MADYFQIKEGTPAEMFPAQAGPMPTGGNIPLQESKAAVPPNPKSAYLNLSVDPRATPRLQNMAFTKLNEGPMKVGVDDVLLDPFTNKPIYTGAGKLPATLDVAVSLIPNLPRNRAEWSPAQMAQVENKVMQLEAQKSPKNVFNMSDIMGKDLGQVQQIMLDGQKQVQAGEMSLTAANKINTAIQSGNLNVGPTANVGQSLGQIGDALGLVNQKGQAKLVNTRQAIQGLAQMWASSRQQAQGQGTMTEGESQLYGKIS